MMQFKMVVNRAGMWISRPSAFFGVALALALLLTIARAFVPFTSPYDEHTHLSYVQYVFDWKLPAEGYPLNSWAKAAFSCYPHSLFGPMTDVPCGTIADASQYPTGGTNTSQSWPPVYFAIVALVMRVPMAVFGDPLIAARLVTATLWSLGSAWLGMIALRKSANVALSLCVVVILVSLPAFYFYTSNVSPHSMNPLIVACALTIAQKIAERSHRDPSAPEGSPGILSFGRAFKNIWLYVFVLFSAAIGFTVPQSLSVVGLVIVYVLIEIFVRNGRVGVIGSIKYGAVFAISGAAAAFAFLGMYAVWQWLIIVRAIPLSAEVDPSRANVDAPHATYPSLLARIVDLWWNFWPNGLVPLEPSGPDVEIVTSVFLLVLSSLSVAAILFWKKGDWLGPLMLALFITAPLFSILYDRQFITAVPVRYGMVFPIIGVLALANSRIAPGMQRILATSVGLLYVSSFVLNYTFVAAKTCGLDNVTHLIQCG